LFAKITILGQTFTVIRKSAYNILAPSSWIMQTNRYCTEVKYR